MLDHRPFANLGRFRNDWLEAYYHFSFAGYYDPNRGGIGPLLVWNDDTVAPRRGFAPHGHTDMEIVTVMRSGLLTHRDSVGNTGQIGPGEMQVMSAGSGITHSEINADADPAILFQIWIEPRSGGNTPRWADRRFIWPQSSGLVALASGRGLEGAVEIDQDATLFAGHGGASGAALTHDLGVGRRAYLVALDPLLVNNVPLAPRDGLALAAIGEIQLTGGRFVLADLP